MVCHVLLDARAMETSQEHVTKTGSHSRPLGSDEARPRAGGSEEPHYLYHQVTEQASWLTLSVQVVQGPAFRRTPCLVNAHCRHLEMLMFSNKGVFVLRWSCPEKALPCPPALPAPAK